MLLGFGWILTLLISGILNESSHGRDFTFVMIGVFFMLSMLMAPILLFSALLPTHEARLIGSPLFLIGCLVFLSAQNQSSNVRWPSLAGTIPWLLTATAILVALPDFPPASRLYKRLFSLILTVGQSMRRYR